MRIKHDQLAVSVFIAGYAVLGIGGFAVLMWLYFAPILLGNKIKLSTLKNLGLGPFFLLLGLAIVSTVLLSPFPFNPYFIGRDLFYFSSAIVMMIVGYNLGYQTKNAEKLLWAAVIALAISTFLIFLPAIASGAIATFSITTRYQYALNSNFAVLVIILMLSTWRTGVRIGTPRLRLIVLMLMIFFVVASLSRVNILILAVAGSMTYFRSRWVGYAAMSLVLAVVFVPFLTLATGAGSGAEIYDESTSFIQKLAGSLSEISIQDQYDLSGMNLHWRGYEAFLGVSAVNTNGLMSVIAGLGLGSFVEGPFLDKLNIIPVFHNGFVTVYVKAGVLGLIIFVYFLFRQAFPAVEPASNTLSPASRAKLLYFRKLAGLMVVSIAVRTLSTHGILFPTPPLELLFLGFLHGARYKIMSREQAVKTETQAG